MRVRRLVRFGTVLADPPWAFGNRRTGGSMSSGSAAKYDLMSLDQIQDLPVPKVMARSYLVYLWVPVPLLPWGPRVLDAWDAPYRTALFWRKTERRGMGFWFRNQVEMLMLGVHGRVTPFRSSRENVHTERPGPHSVKPEEFYTYIEGLAPAPYLELFATRPRRQWTSVGYDVGTEVGQWFDARVR